MPKKTTCTEASFIEKDFEEDIKKCCSEHMTRYTELKEKLPIAKKDYCDLNKEMISIANKILGKIDVASKIYKLAGDEVGLNRVSERKKFVDGVLTMLAADSKEC